MTARHAVPGSQRSGFLPDRTVHLHALDRCNLACAHCYSASSPQAGQRLPEDALLAALPDLRAAGYEVISLSGGEPLLYLHLDRVLDAARAEGFRLVAISNGFRVTPRFEAVLDRLDGLAISFDGPEEVHNRVRGNARAWDMAWNGLTHLGQRGQPAAAAYTVSRESMEYVPEFVDRCAALGVQAVQLRPLVMAGRAVTDYAGPELGPRDLERLWLMGQALSLGYAGEVAVHTDLQPGAAIAADSCAWSGLLSGTAKRLSDAINPLVIRPDGRLKPFTYDFPDRFDLGHLADLPKLTGQGHELLAETVAHALECAGREGGLIDWFAHLRDVAVQEVITSCG